MGFVLSILARILFFIVGCINPIIVVITHSKKHGFLKTVNSYWLISATELDKYGNYAFRATWNITFRKSWGYKFGVKTETISSVLGKNQQAGSLTQVGHSVCWLLDTIEKDHCKKSINNLK